MAMQLGEAFVILRGDDSRLRNDLSRAKGETETTAAAMQKAADRVRDAWASVGRNLTLYVTAPIIAGAAVSVNAMMEQENATMSLAAALAKTGEATQTNIKRFEEFATAIQQTTVHADEQITSGMAFMKNIGVTTDQLEQATKAAIGLAAMYRIDLQSAFKLVGRASQGQTQTLARFGIVIDQTGTKAQKFAQVLALGMKGMPAAEAQARTAASRFAQFKNALNDAAESLGGALLPVLVGFMSIMRPLVAFLQNLPTPVKSFGVTILLAAAAIGPLISMIVKLTLAWKTLTKATVAQAAAAAAAWAKGHPAKAAAAIAAIVAAIGGATWAINNSIGNATDDFNNYIKEINKQVADIKGLDVGTATAPNDEAIQKQKEHATALQDIIRAQDAQYKAQADEIVGIYNNLKAAREEEEKRQRASIGWMGAGDLWRGAAVAGASARFGQEHNPAMMGRPDIRNEFRIEQSLLKRAVDDWRYQREHAKAMEYLTKELVEVVKVNTSLLAGTAAY